MKIAEIFESIQGEGSRAGLPMMFVRFAGCNLRCSYCDTVYALENGAVMEPEAVLKRCLESPWKHTLLTGGEPLLQDAAFELAASLYKAGSTVVIETNGTIDISRLPEKAVKVMDIKTPGSGFESKNLYSNINMLGPADDVKFVLTSRDDFDWAVEMVKSKNLLERCGVLFSPAVPLVAPAILAAWILESGINIRFNPNVHRYIWPEQSRGR